MASGGRDDADGVPFVGLVVSFEAILDVDWKAGIVFKV
jgi:hypothetical protein